MTENLFLHIGRAKTATSALQQFFWKNRRRLAERGIHYIKTGIQGDAHHVLAASFATKRAPWMPKVGNPSQLKDSFADEVRGLPGSALVSSEYFQHIQPEVFTKYLSPQDTKIIFYVRPQDEVIVSEYNQMYKARGLDESVANFMGRTPFLDYEKFLEPWSEVFGRSNIMVRHYLPRGPQSSIFEDFLSVLGVEDSAGFWTPPDAVNKSMSLKSLQLMKLIGKRTIRDRHRFAELVGARLGYVDQIQSHELLTPAEQQTIRETFRDSNANVARLYLGRDLLADVWEANMDDKLWKRVYGRVRRFLDR
jgi:hypothetical protein